MVNKGVQPTKTELARGQITPDELVQVLKTAAAGADSPFIKIYWRDGHQAVVSDIDKLEPIEDVGELDSLFCMFDYADGSQLTMTVLGSRLSHLSALGETARQRQSEVGQLWAGLPGRATMTSKWGFFAWVLSVGMMTGALVQLVLGGFYQSSLVAWGPRVSAVLLSVGLFLFLRARTALRYRSSKPVSLIRRDSRQTDIWTVIAGVTGVISMAIAIVAYVHPLN
jgi:hypothetical protein